MGLLSGLSAGIYNKTGTIKFKSSTTIGTNAGLYIASGSNNYIYSGNIIGHAIGVVAYHGETGTLYMENASIENGKYIGKYDNTSFEEPKEAIMVGGGQNADGFNMNVNINNCKIVGKDIAFYIRNTGNNVNISNSNITGQLNIATGNLVTFGQGNNITRDNLSEYLATGVAEGLVEFTTESYAGRDK